MAWYEVEGDCTYYSCVCRNRAGGVRACIYEFMCVCKTASYIYRQDFIVCSSMILFLYACVYTSALCVKHLQESESTHASTCDRAFVAISVSPYMCLHRHTVCLTFLCARMCLCMHVFALLPDASLHTPLCTVCLCVCAREPQVWQSSSSTLALYPS